MSFLKPVRHFYELLINHIGNDVVKVSPDPSTNILRNVTDPEQRQDAATLNWVSNNFVKLISNAVNATTGSQIVSLPNIADATEQEVYLFRKTDITLNTVEVIGDASIDGRSSIFLYNRYETILIKKIGNAWGQITDYSYNNSRPGNGFTLTADSPNLITLDFDEVLTVPAASNFPVGKIFEIKSNALAEEYLATSEYSKIVFSNNDLFEESNNEYFIPLSDSISFYSDSNRWRILRYPLRKLQRFVSGPAYTIKPSDGIIIVDATSNDVTITLPDNKNNFMIENRSWFVKRIDNSGYIVTIVAGGTNTIEGNVSDTISSRDSYELYAYYETALSGLNIDWKII
jgi:hypothetical protein